MEPLTQTAGAKIAPLESAIKEQGDLLCRLKEALAGLKQRLTPIRLAAPTSQAQDSQEKAQESEIVQILQGHNRELAEMIRLTIETEKELQI